MAAYTQDRLRVQPAPRRTRRRRRRSSGGQPDPGEDRRRQPDQVLHLHHQGEPHLRSGLRRHQGRQRRPEPVHVPREGHAQSPQAGRSSCCSTTSTCDGEVSADGHEWTMGAYATDFVEKVVAAGYRGSPNKKIGYPGRGQLRRDRPAGRRLPLGPLHEAKVSYRSYGEWISNGKKPDDPGKPRGQGARRPVRPEVPRLRPGLSRREAGRALHRGAEAIRASRRNAAAARSCACRTTTPPAPRSASPHRRRMVADNDLALGTVVEGGDARASSGRRRRSSSSRTTPRTGRTTSTRTARWRWSISPYTKRQVVDSTHVFHQRACCARWS